MRMKRFSLLLLALVFVASLAVVGCGGGGSNFKVTNLVFNPAIAYTGDEVEVSATVTNSGGASGNYTATLTVDGAAVGSQTVELAAAESKTIHFDYTPTAAGTLTIAIGSLSGSLGVIEQTPGYWDIQYKVVTGSRIVLNYSLQGITPVKKVINFNESSGFTLTMRVNKSVVDGKREVIIPAATFIWPTFMVKGITTGVNMDLTVPLGEDAVGVLYVEDGVGDVDMHSESTSGQTPIQVNTQGDGTKDPAGSMVIPMVLVGNFETTVGQDGFLDFGLTFTTGHIDNIVHISTNKKFDGTTLTSEGVPFAEDSDISPAPYVATAGTITTTGTGGCLGIKLVGMRIDFQVEIMFALEPVSE